VVALALAAGQTLAVADLNEAITPASATIQGHLAAGGLHSCAVLTTGEVQCWGANDEGQLGNGTVTAGTTPVGAVGITTAKAVSAGNSHSCALLTDGTVRCWGLASNGQLGDGTTGNPATRLRTAPVNVTGITGALAVTAGGFHSCAILGDGTVRCWGDDGSGQLGDGNSGDLSLTPKPVSGITSANPARAIAAGDSSTCALLADATVKCWGSNAFGQLGDGTTTSRATPVTVAGLPSPSDHAALALTVGYGHACVLLDDGTGRCWGDNTFGQLGQETPDADTNGIMDPSPVPLEVRHDADPDPLIEDLQPLEGITAVSAGEFHTCALIDDGSARCWGQNDRGQLGVDPDPLTDGFEDSTSALEVGGGFGGASAVTAGGQHTCAIVGAAVQCWGYNFYGQLGTSVGQSTVPVQVTAVQGATTVSVGAGFACALVDAKKSGEPACWGDNTDGRLGADLSAPNARLRVPVSGISSASAIDTGNGHACLIPAGSTGPRCWGSNANGQLGDGTNLGSAKPVAVAAGFDATAISTGGAFDTSERGHTCAVRPNQKVGCWGYNAYGQLGDTTTTDGNTPMTVQADIDPLSTSETLQDLDGVSAVTAGGFHACALASGTVWCWGANDDGQLGDGTTTERHWAVHVQTDTDPNVDVPLSGVVTIAAGHSHTCALLGDGRVMCWGANGAGQLGDGTTTGRHLPTQVDDITIGNPGKGITASPARSIAAGEAHTCARLEDDSLLCWGDNGFGQLGIGSTANASSPEVVFGPAPSAIPASARPVIRSISAGKHHTCAVYIDSTVYCWGDNSAGQLGDGVGAVRVSPATVTALAGSV
jgi:alpha-tubulin suppressor-like RCC1 family protein